MAENRVGQRRIGILTGPVQLAAQFPVLALDTAEIDFHVPRLLFEGLLVVARRHRIGIGIDNAVTLAELANFQGGCVEFGDRGGELFANEGNGVGGLGELPFQAVVYIGFPENVQYHLRPLGIGVGVGNDEYVRFPGLPDGQIFDDLRPAQIDGIRSGDRALD